MKKKISLVLLSMLLVGCATQKEEVKVTQTSMQETTTMKEVVETKVYENIEDDVTTTLSVTYKNDIVTHVDIKATKPFPEDVRLDTQEQKEMLKRELEQSPEYQEEKERDGFKKNLEIDETGFVVSFSYDVSKINAKDFEHYKTYEQFGHVLSQGVTKTETEKELAEIGFKLKN
ncbi:DUF1307 domain-containing protein [Granulicatella sp. zg-ZJ]|uniref:DUF1307 domain-containing protein n=1 Tax=Granulicatella sp. zg-ZJ TaxID=2678504 RepID=UPI0013D09A5F|nr:DUF1307 domain-containing protein [Granulicatella sp. zg-ZJ]NEW62951.1 DUF1307 domain-containing protein [Granulicatella sp. zg-ZJ]